ncbi:MAG: sigma factor [Longimicrobiaceae bacterium]
MLSESAGDPPFGGENDQRLVRRIACSDSVALGELYDRWFPLVYALAFGVMGSAADAEEVLESTFWHVWMTAREDECPRTCVGAWLIAVASSRAHDRLHARSRGGPYPTVEVLACASRMPSVRQSITRTGRSG